MNKENKQTSISGLEEHLGCKIDDLREITDIIYKSYKDKFSTKRIYGQNQFHIICQNVTDKPKDSYWTLAEKVCKRQYDMLSLKSVLKDNREKMIEFEEAKALEDIMERLVPLEILWAMEEEYEDDYTFNDHEQKSYDYLVHIATYFLEQTEQMAEEFRTDSHLNLKLAGPNGYEYTEEELKFMEQNKKRKNVLSGTRCIDTRYPNPIDLPELYLSKEEREEVIDKTIGRVLKKLK